jgi:hypothetical protein
VNGLVEQVEGEGVDGEVAAQEVVLQPPRRDGGKRAGGAIPLLTGRGDVDLRVALGGDFVGQELREGADAAVHPLGEGAGQRRTAGLEREVDVDHLPPEEQVTDGAADEKRAAVLLRGDLLDEVDRASLLVRKVLENGHRINVSYRLTRMRSLCLARNFETVCLAAFCLPSATSRLKRTASIA